MMAALEQAIMSLDDGLGRTGRPDRRKAQGTPARPGPAEHARLGPILSAEFLGATCGKWGPWRVGFSREGSMSISAMRGRTLHEHTDRLGGIRDVLTGLSLAEKDLDNGFLAASYWKADFPAELTDDAIKVAVEHGSRVPSVESANHFYPIDGAVQRVAPDATAFAYGNASVAPVIAGMWPDPADNAANTQWVATTGTPCTHTQRQAASSTSWTPMISPGSRTTTRTTTSG